MGTEIGSDTHAARTDRDQLVIGVPAAERSEDVIKSRNGVPPLEADQHRERRDDARGATVPAGRSLGSRERTGV